MIQLVPVVDVTEVVLVINYVIDVLWFMLNVACLVVVLVLVVRLSSASHLASCLDVILVYILVSAYR
jgi:hypothetical protein